MPLFKTAFEFRIRGIHWCEAPTAAKAAGTAHNDLTFDPEAGMNNVFFADDVAISGLNSHSLKGDASVDASIIETPVEATDAEAVAMGFKEPPDAA